LWALLRGRQTEALKFRRQVPIGAYVADFACLRHRLLVEVDGPFHDPERDDKRDAVLAGQGFRVLRFTTHEVMSKPELVLARIVAACSPQA
jgi:very-short-patch-repair endonuclease